MEIEQLEKQVDWLDEERRKDKLRLGALEERLNAVEGNVPPLAHQIKQVDGEIVRLQTMLSRLDQFDEAILQARVEHKQHFEDLEHQIRKQQEENDKMRRLEVQTVEGKLNELRKEIEAIPELKRSLKARVDEESRLTRLIDEVRARIDTFRRSEEEYTRTYRLLDDGRRQDAKKLTDLQGEVAAIRKRADENRAKIELNLTTHKRIETRLVELSTVETERREAMEKFLGNQALYQVERERVWKDWQARFEQIEEHTSNLGENLQALEATHRSVKRTQQTVDEVAQKVERRINEIAEIQRLAEERFRQEWVTFKADDQKRWTNYTLTLEEQRGESQRTYEKLSEQVGRLSDEIHEMQDLIAQVTEQTEKRLQSLLAVAHDWVSNYERSFGRSR